MVARLHAHQRQVWRMIVVEALLLSGLGTALGLLAGLDLGYVLVGVVSLAGYQVAYNFPYAEIVIALTIGLLCGVGAALVPARQAARLQIVRALRYE